MEDTSTAYPRLFFLPAPLTIALLAIVLYLPTLSFEYTQDDAIVIEENVFTQKGIQGIPDLWTHDTFYGFFQDDSKSSLVAGGRYRPFTPTIFALEGTLFGFSPAVGHFFNVLYYGLLCGLIYLFLFQLFRKFPKGAQWALWTSLIFLAHPIHTEVVCNIKGRDEIMALLGAVAAALILWRGDSIRHYVLAFVFFLVAMFSKENAAVFVLIFPALLWLQERKKHATLSFGLFGSGLLIYLLARYAVLGTIGGGEEPRELMNNPFMQWNGNSYEVLSYIERIPTILLGLLTYLKLIIWPWPLTHDYYPLQLPIISYSDYRMYLSLLLYGGLTFWAFKKIKASNIAAWGWLWFIVALFPMSNILINVGTFLSERFLFISSLGFAMIVSYFLFSQAATRRLSPGIRTGIGIAVITLYVIAVGLRMPAWKSNFTLFTTDVETSKNSAKVNNAAAGEYNRVAGLANSTEEQKMWARKALPKSNRALELHPTYKNAFLQKGNAYFYLRDYETAIEQYKNCLQLDPNDPDANSNLALAYRSAGQYYGEEKQDLSSAVRHLNKAYEMNPNDYETLRLLGVAYGFSGRSDQAIRFFKQALQMKAGEARSYYNLGAAYMQNGQLDSGQVYMERAKEIDPSLFEKNDGE